MFLNTGIVGSNANAVAVQLPSLNLININTANPVYSGMRFDSDGKIYVMNAIGQWQSAATWLFEGLASAYYLFRTIDSGSLTNDDGDGNQLNTDDLDFYITNAVPWFDRQTSVTFKIADDSGGSNILVSRQYNFSAYRQGTGSPP